MANSGAGMPGSSRVAVLVGRKNTRWYSRFFLYNLFVVHLFTKLFPEDIFRCMLTTFYDLYDFMESQLKPPPIRRYWNKLKAPSEGQMIGVKYSLFQPLRGVGEPLMQPPK